MSDIDRVVLGRLYETLGSEVFEDFVTDFLHDAERLERLLVAALNAHQGAAARRAAHELRGLAALFGATALARCCLDLEQVSDPATMHEKVAWTRELFASTLEEIVRILESDRSNAEAI